MKFCLPSHFWCPNLRGRGSLIPNLLENSKSHCRFTEKRPWTLPGKHNHALDTPSTPGHAICYSSKLWSKQFHGFIFSVYKIIKIKFPIIHFHILNCEVKLINGMIYVTFNINIPHILKNDDILLDNPCTKHHKNEGDCT